VALGSAMVGVFLYSLIAYVIVKTSFTFRGVLDFLSWIPWSIPGILLGIALLWTFLGTRIFITLYGSVYILMIAMIIKSMPIGTQVIKSVILQLGRELEEASIVSGASWFSTYRRILVPLLFPALVTVGLLVFISAVRDISTIVLLATGETRTLSLLMLEFAAMWMSSHRHTSPLFFDLFNVPTKERLAAMRGTAPGRHTDLKCVPLYG